MNRLVRFVRARWLPLILSVAVALWTFPVLVFDVGDGLDPSWPVALQMATNRRMAFGRAIVFTFGPLGALTSSAMAVPKFGLAAAWVHILLLAATSWFIVTRLSKVFHPLIAAVLALGLTWAIAPALQTDPLVILYLVIAVLAAALGGDGPIRPWSEVAVGVVVGCTLLWKFDVGLEIGSVALVFLALETFSKRFAWRSTVTWAVRGLASAFFAVIVVWAILGQPMAALLDYVRTSWTVATGYGAMTTTSSMTWFAAAGVVAAAGTAMLAFERWADNPKPRLVGNVFFVAFALYLLARQSWTRSDGGHFGRFAAVVILLSVALVIRRTTPQFVLTAGVAAVMVVGAGGTFGFLHPGRSAHAVQRLWTMTVSSKARADRVAWGRHALPTVMQVPPTMLARMNGHTVHIDPWNTSVVWAYPKLRWDPLPVFQSYAAYNSALDHKNARKLAAPSAPQFILSEPGTIDARVPRFESPEAVLAELCNYRLAEASTRWHLLERRPHPACGASRKLGGAKGKTMIVPAGRPDELVIARVHMNGDGLRGLLLRPRPVHLQLSPNGPQQRFIVGTAPGPHVLVLPACLTTDIRSPRRWANFDTNPYGPLVFSRTARVEFEAVTYRC